MTASHQRWRLASRSDQNRFRIDWMNGDAGRVSRVREKVGKIVGSSVLAQASATPHIDTSAAIRDARHCNCEHESFSRACAVRRASGRERLSVRVGVIPRTLCASRRLLLPPRTPFWRNWPHRLKSCAIVCDGLR